MNDLAPLLVSGVDGPSAERRRGHGDRTAFAGLLAGMLKDAEGAGLGEGSTEGPGSGEGGDASGWPPLAPAWAGTVEADAAPAAVHDALAALDAGDVDEAVAALLAEATSLAGAARLAEALAGAAEASRGVDPLLAQVATEVAGHLAAAADGKDAGLKPSAVVADALARSTARALAELEGTQGDGARVEADAAGDESGPQRGTELPAGPAERSPRGHPADPPEGTGDAPEGEPPAGERALFAADGAQRTETGVAAGPAGEAGARPAEAAGFSAPGAPSDGHRQAGPGTPESGAPSTASMELDNAGEPQLPAPGESRPTAAGAVVAAAEGSAATAPASLPGPAGAGASGAVARVMAALEQLRHAGPPRSVSLELPELEGLRLRVSLRGTRTVDVRVAGRRLGDDDEWVRDLGVAVASRGLELGEIDDDEDHRYGRSAGAATATADQGGDRDGGPARSGDADRAGLRL